MALLGMSTKFWKGAAISFIMSVHLSAWNNSAATGWIFMKFDIWVFENLGIIHIWLKSD